MARTWVATEDLVGGQLPEICARSGRPTDNRIRLKGTAVPSWAPLATLLAVTPFLVINAHGPAPPDGILYLHPKAEFAQRRLAAVRNIALAVAVVALVAQAFVLGLPLLILGLVALVVALVWTGLLAAAALGGQLDDTGDWVELRGAHPDFVAASDKRYANEEETV